MRPSVTGLLSLVVAVSAATLADPLVEYASNSGVFGVGSFTDHSTINVLPAAITALGLAAAYVVFLARRSFANTPGVVRRLPSARLPVTFGLQMLVLFGMESLEQLVVVGHPLGGSVWLGGPIVVALLVHALACVALSFLLSRVLASLADVARTAREFVYGICIAGYRGRVRRHASGDGMALLRERTSARIAFREARAAEPLSLRATPSGSTTAESSANLFTRRRKQ